MCGAADRIYVLYRVADEFTDRLAPAMGQASHYGNPLIDKGRDLGPLISERPARRGAERVERRSPRRPGHDRRQARRRRPTGYYYEPTVLAACRQDMDIIRKEIFGPVIPIVEFDDLDQAIAMANDSD